MTWCGAYETHWVGKETYAKDGFSNESANGTQFDNVYCVDHDIIIKVMINHFISLSNSNSNVCKCVNPMTRL